MFTQRTSNNQAQTKIRHTPPSGKSKFGSLKFAAVFFNGDNGQQVVRCILLDDDEEINIAVDNPYAVDKNNDDVGDGDIEVDDVVVLECQTSTASSAVRVLTILE